MQGGADLVHLAWRQLVTSKIQRLPVADPDISEMAAPK
jgi:hypothetical protein